MELSSVANSKLTEALWQPKKNQTNKKTAYQPAVPPWISSRACQFLWCNFKIYPGVTRRQSMLIINGVRSLIFIHYMKQSCLYIAIMKKYWRTMYKRKKYINKTAENQNNNSNSSERHRAKTRWFAMTQLSRKSFKSALCCRREKAGPRTHTHFDVHTQTREQLCYETNPRRTSTNGN